MHFPPPPILNRIESELTDSRSVKTIKKNKYRFHCLIDWSVEVTYIVTAIILENMFGNINQLFLPTGEYGRGKCSVELACLQMLNISLQKICIYLSIYLFIYLVVYLLFFLFVYLFIYLFIYSFSLLKVGKILVLTGKNQSTNQKYSHTNTE